MELSEVFKFRCETDLKIRFDKIATLKRKTVSVLAREVIWDYVEAMEREGLPPSMAMADLVLNESHATRKSSIARASHHETSRSARKTK